MNKNPYVVAAEKVDAAASLVSELTGVAQRFEEDAARKGRAIKDLVDSNKIFSGAIVAANETIDDLKDEIVGRDCEINDLKVDVEDAEVRAHTADVSRRREKSAKKDVIEVAVARGKNIAELDGKLVDAEADNLILEGDKINLTDEVDELRDALVLGNLEFVSAEQALEESRKEHAYAEARNDGYRDAHIAACQTVEGLSYHVVEQEGTIQQKNERIKNLSADKRAILELALQRGEKITDLEIDNLLLGQENAGLQRSVDEHSADVQMLRDTAYSLGKQLSDEVKAGVKKGERIHRQRESIRRLYKNQAEFDELLMVYESSLDDSRKHNADLRRHIVELLDERYQILTDLTAQRQQAVNVGARNSELERVTDELVESTVLSLKKLGFLSAVKDDYASRWGAAVEAVVSADKRAVALENALAADEADIAKLERGYAALEDEKDAIVSEKLAVEKILVDGIKSWQAKHAESDRLADELIEANVGLQGKIAGARAEAGRQEVRAQYAEARSAGYQNAHLKVCETVGQKNARISELESAVGRRDALLASHGLSLASAYENDLLCNITSALKTYTAGSGAEIDSYARSVVGRVCEKHLSAVDAVNVIKTLGRKEVGKEPVSDVTRTFNAVLGRISSPAEIADLLCNLAHNKSIGVSLNRLQEAYS